jgi:hypothetical protein
MASGRFRLLAAGNGREGEIWSARLPGVIPLFPTGWISEGGRQHGQSRGGGMKAFKTATLVLGPVLAFFLCMASLVQAATPDEDMRPIKSGVTITGIVEEDYSDGLLLSTDEGVTYVVLTPEEVSLEQEEAFHKHYKGKRVSLTGDVYKDEDGTLSLSVKTLPRE